MPSVTGRSHPNHNVLVVGTVAGSAPTLSIDSLSTLNVQDNDLIVHHGNLTNINTLIQQGRDAGNWDGTGNGKLNTTDSSTFGLVYGNGTAAGHTGAKTQL